MSTQPPANRRALIADLLAQIDADQEILDRVPQEDIWDSYREQLAARIRANTRRIGALRPLLDRHTEDVA